MKGMYALVATITLWSWAGAAASSADTASTSNEDQDTLAQIVVTAQKRTENLQSVPIAISTDLGQVSFRRAGGEQYYGHRGP